MASPNHTLPSPDISDVMNLLSTMKIQNDDKPESRISKNDQSKKKEEEELKKKEKTSEDTLQKLVKLVNSNLKNDSRLCEEIIEKNKKKIFLEDKHKWNDDLKKEFSDVMKKINYPRGMNFKQVMNACYLDTNRFPYKTVRIGNKKYSYSCDSCIFFGKCSSKRCKARLQHDLSKGEVDLIKDILQPLKDEKNPVISTYTSRIEKSKLPSIEDSNYLNKNLNKQMKDLYTRTQIVHDKARSEFNHYTNLVSGSGELLKILENLSELGKEKKEHELLSSIDQMLSRVLSLQFKEDN